MILVLETTGKNDSVDTVKIITFVFKEIAEKYCKKNTDDPMEEKYWRYCEIIEEGKEYEIARYHNYIN